MANTPDVEFAPPEAQRAREIELQFSSAPQDEETGR
jgi:hypothetical protein